MKVRIVVMLNVDPEAWDMNYGTGTTSAAVRADVQTWAHSLLHDAADMSGNLL